MDPRTTPSNARVAASHLRGKVDAARYTEGIMQQIITPVINLDRTPNGPRDRQLLMGNTVTTYEDSTGLSYVQSLKDSYCGYVASNALGDPTPPSHWVSALTTQIYSAPDIKSNDVMTLSFGSQVTGLSEDDKFVTTPFGYIPKQHLSQEALRKTDPTKVAQQFLGVPYLWGGNSSFGIDCSGLIQTSYLACGLPCPADSDHQCEALGTSLPDNSDYQKGDLLFWKGHVAMALDPETMIHATAHYMAVVEENIYAAISRIDAQGQGPLLAHKRL